MITVDFHTHLLSPEVEFDRFFDKIAIALFAKNMGYERKRLFTEGYGYYIFRFLQLLKESKYIEKAVLFGIDAKYDKKGRFLSKNKTACASTDDVLSVYEKNRDLIIPFMSVNPYRPDALSLLEIYAERGCRGAKFLQNYWQIDTNDPSLVPYYEKLRDLSLPLIIHTGLEIAIESNKRYEKTDMLRLPLETGVKVIAAHMACGHVEYKLLFWRNFSQNPRFFNKEYFKLIEMLEIYENLYADLSSMLNPLKARVLRHLSTQKHIHSKLLFGTDFPIPIIVEFMPLDIDRHRKKKIAAIKNPFDRYTEVFVEIFGKESEIFTNWKKLL
ncbi:amidohydrolase family protein [Nitrosophilus alvini]|uniref:amidohydrolase family protein n=1 Tax=Nitrosophilus alvini TaxID=2714855 RepID=UPI00190CDED8|nr:amidohydrolase family protein [Nitrosophilus alvini]